MSLIKSMNSTPKLLILQHVHQMKIATFVRIHAFIKEIHHFHLQKIIYNQINYTHHYNQPKLELTVFLFISSISINVAI